MSDRPVPLPRPGDPLRIAFLIYRGNPHCGGQGVYSRHLTRELTELGHSVTMFAGPAVAGRRRPGRAREGRRPRPLPPREPVSRPVAVRVPHDRRPAGVRDHVHAPGSPSRTRSAGASTRRCATAATSSTSCTTTSASARGLLGFIRDDWPFVNTLHHPITVDRDLDLAHASGPWRRMTLRRWYGFLRMQMQRRAPGAAPHHGVGELEEGHRRADGRRHRHAATSCRSVSTRSGSARCRTSRACRAGC